MIAALQKARLESVLSDYNGCRHLDQHLAVHGRLKSSSFKPPGPKLPDRLAASNEVPEGVAAEIWNETKRAWRWPQSATARVWWHLAVLPTSRRHAVVREPQASSVPIAVHSAVHHPSIRLMQERFEGSMLANNDAVGTWARKLGSRLGANHRRSVG